MLHPYQRRLLFSYFANAARRLDRRDPAAADLASWVVDNAPILDDEKPGEVVRRRRGRRERMANSGDPHLTEDGWAAFRRALAEKVGMAGRPRPDLMSRRLRRLAAITGISATDIRILEILLLYQTSPVVESVVDDVFMGGSRRAHFNMRDSALPYFLDMSHRAVAMRFTPEAPLVRSGLVTVDDDGDLSLVDRLTRLANLPGRELGIRDILLGEPDQAELEWADFDHVHGRPGSRREAPPWRATGRGGPASTFFSTGRPVPARPNSAGPWPRGSAYPCSALGQRGQAGRRAEPFRTARRSFARPVPARARREFPPPVRRDGRSAARYRQDSLLRHPRTPRRAGRIEAVHEQAAGERAGADAVGQRTPATKSPKFYSAA